MNEINLFVFTEELSACRLFEKVLPKLGCKNFTIFSHQGKQDLLKAIEKTVPTLSKNRNAKILITIDQDDEDCSNLKNKIQTMLIKKRYCDCKIRIICKELENWYLGDLNAIQKAYPRFNSEKHKNSKNLKKVDTLQNSNQYLLKNIPELSNKKVLPKLEMAQIIAEHLNLEMNRSTSFMNTIDAIKKLTK